jgi:phosphoribosyl-dephospho-CoA transferase
MITARVHNKRDMVLLNSRARKELKKILSYSKEENESFERLSDINVLLNSKGQLKNLSRGQIRTLKRRGLIARRTRGFDKYTDKGLQLLKELKLI